MRTGILNYAVLLLLGLICMGLSAQDLFVDFNAGTLADGYEAYDNAVNEDLSALSSEVYSVFGTDITVSVSTTDSVSDSEFLFADLSDDIVPADLLTDFIGIYKGNQDSLYITITGLPAGNYEWKSYHHYATRQGLIYNMNIDNGSSVTKISDIHVSHELVDEYGSATAFFSADGVNPVIIAITCYWDIDLPVIINGFDLDNLATNETDIYSFEFDGLHSKAAINGDDHTIAIKVGDDTDVSALIPVIDICPGATISPASGVAQNFTNNVVYTITSEDGQYSQEWTVSVSAYEDWSMLNVDFNVGTIQPFYDAFNNALHQVKTSLSDEVFFALGTDITVSVDVTEGVSNNEFLFTTNNDDLEPTAILNDYIGINKGNNDTLYITISGLPEGTYDWLSYHHYANRQGLIYRMNIDNGSSMTTITEIHASHEFSDEYGTANATFTADGIHPVVIALTCTWEMDLPIVINGFNIERYVNGVKLRSFMLEEGAGNIQMNTRNNSISLQVAEKSVSNFYTPIVKVSSGASIYPESGTTQDFTNDVTYTITSADGLKSEDWTVQLSASDYSNDEQNDVSDLMTSSASATVSVYPNPASEMVYIDLSTISGSSNVSIYNLSGSLVYEENYINEDVITIHGLSQGMYIVEVRSEHTLSSIKLLVE